ncbi:MAG: hypothetical protein PWR31_1972 [Bacillota bacterium]|nr:hypothetical protein [Bacillota bacterium]
MRELLVATSVTDVWSAPGAGATRERFTQVLLGDRVVVLMEKDGWVYGRVPDGYTGWLSREALSTPVLVPGQRRATVTVPVAFFRPARSPHTAGRLFPSQAFLGTRLPELERTGEEVLLALPGGRSAYLPAAAVSPPAPALNGPPTSAPAPGQLLEYALTLLGTPYLWGGVTAAGVDCSGLVYIAYRTAGIDLPRDADQQYKCGWAVTQPLAAGDLVFFATEEPGFPAHVGLYLGRGRFLHASSRLGGVVVTSLNAPFYRERYLGARRVVTQEGFAAGEGEVTRRIII